MKRIAIITGGIYPYHRFGGAEKYVYYFVQELSRQGVGVTVITSKSSKIQDRQIKHSDIEYVFLGRDFSKFADKPIGRIFELIFSFKAYMYLRKRQFDLVHGFKLTPFFPVLLDKEKKIVLHIFVEEYRIRSRIKVNLKTLLNPQLLRFPVITLFKLMPVKYMVENCGVIATEGDFQTKEMLELFNCHRSKFFEISVGLDYQNLRSKYLHRRFSRDEIGLKEDDFVILAVHRLIPEKGINYLIKAMKLLVMDKLSAKMILVGDGYRKQEVLNLIKNSHLDKHVLHYSKIPEDFLYALYSVGDVFVSPTLQDDFVMGIEEAMAFELPIVSTGQRWLVHHGINGLLVPKADPHAIYRALLNLLEDKNRRKRMGSESLRIVEQYDWSTIIRLYLDYLRKRGIL